MRKLQPNILIWNDGGDRADLRWVGTEAGNVGETNWSLLNATGEVNTSIRPEWFYHPIEDTKVKTVPQLMDTYYNSVGRNGTLLLNFPIMPNGLIHETDEKNVLAFAKARAKAFSKNHLVNTKITASNVREKSSQFTAQKAIDANKESYWATDENTTTGSLTVNFGKPTTFNRFLVQEYIRLGQRVKAFTLEANINGVWKEIAKETTIGYKRILKFNTIKATQLRINITEAKASPLICNMEVYQAPIILSQPRIRRNQNGEIQIVQTDAESEVYYTLDGSIPTSKSSKYTSPITTDLGKLTVKAISFNPQNNTKTAVSEEIFDISRKNWSIIGEADKNASRILDGNENSSWLKQKAPTEIIINLGKTENIAGFRYLPPQHFWEETSLITHYQFEVSADNINWKVISEGEFSNIKNNPIWQVKPFKTVSAQYIKLKALKTLGHNANVGFAEIDLITE